MILTEKNKKDVASMLNMNKSDDSAIFKRKSLKNQCLKQPETMKLKD